jgi:flotillin
MQAFLLLALIIGGLIFQMVIIMIIYYSRYKKVPSGTAMVIYGKGTDPKKDFTVIVSGGKFILPVVQAYELLPLDVRTLEIVMRDVVVKGPGEKILTHMKFVTQFRTSFKKELIDNAVRNLLHKTEPEINTLAQEIIEANVRRLAAQKDIEWLNVDRDEFSIMVQESSGKDLGDYGIEVKSLVMTGIEDDRGYLDNIGRRKVREVYLEYDRSIIEDDIDLQKIPEGPDRHKRRAKVLNKYALGLMENHDYDRAVKILQKTIEVDPEEEEYKKNLEKCLEIIH